MNQEKEKDVAEEEVIRNPDTSEKAGIPWPQAQKIKLPLILPKLVSEPVGARKQVRLLEEMLPWCILRRDYGVAMRLCSMLMLRLDAMYLRKRPGLLKKDYFKRHKNTLVRWIGCCTEALLATGFSTHGAVLDILRMLVFVQPNYRQGELTAADLAVHLLEEGEVEEAERVMSLQLCTMPETTATKAPRLALRGFLDYASWMRFYLRHVQQVAEAQVGRESEDEEEADGGLRSPLRSGPAAAPDQLLPHLPHQVNGWEHVPKAWSRANAHMDFREHWQKCEQCLKQVIMHHPSKSVKLAYYLAQTYCAAGKVDRAVWIGARVAFTAPGDPDAVALAVLMSQLMDTYSQQLSQLDAAAALPPGTAATLLRLTCIRSDADVGGGAGGEGAGYAVGKRLQERQEDDHYRDAEEEWQEQEPLAKDVDPSGRRAVRNTEAPPVQVVATTRPPRTGTAAVLLAGAMARKRSESGKMEGPPTEGAVSAAAQVAPAAAAAAAVEQEPGPAPSTSQPQASRAGKTQQQTHGQQSARAARKDTKATKTVGSSGSLKPGGFHDLVEMQLEALKSDPLCAAALAGLVRSGNHCSSCAVALVRGCLLHLDSCTTGVVFSSYEVDVWARLDSALQELAAMVTAAPRGPQRTAARNTQWCAAGDAVAANGGSRKRKCADHDGMDDNLEPVMLWQKRVAPELRSRSEWWVHTAFSEPPVLFSRDDIGSDGGTLLLLPEEALIKHLQHRASVAAVMMGPCNYYTQHVLREMQLLRQRLEDHLAAARHPWKNLEERCRRRHSQKQPQRGYAGHHAARRSLDSSEVSSEGLKEDDAMDVDDVGVKDEAEIMKLETALAVMDSCIASVREAMNSITALVRRLAPPPPPPSSLPRPLPPTLLASVPRALRRRSAPTDTEAAAAIAVAPVSFM